MGGLGAGLCDFFICGWSCGWSCEGWEGAGLDVSDGCDNGNGVVMI